MTMTATHPDVTRPTGVLANWRIYAMDGALLGIFMISACVSVVVLEHPSSPIHQAIGTGFVRRAIIGALMGLTAVGLVYSPWGKRSGAFMNPAMVLCFLRLGRLKPLDAAGYIAGQFIGGTMGVLISSFALGSLVSHPAVNYAATLPGNGGLFPAWLGEFAIAALMITVVMGVNKIATLARFTGFFAAGLVFLYITFEAPISGMSLNPARTFSSAIVANLWTGWWIYFTAPVLGMLAGTELHRLLGSEHQRLCGKVNHSQNVACFVKCGCVERF